MRLGIAALTLMLSLTRLFASDTGPDFVFIDDYLNRWDQFSQGSNQLIPSLKSDKERFLDELTTAVSMGDKRAMSRVVFYAVVQVGGFIPYDSPLGKAIEKAVGSQVAISSLDNGEKSYFAGDLYFWWEGHKKDYTAYPLYDEYIKRDFAKQTVIPMYTAVAKK
jgi:hypothetical protein